VQFCRRIKAIEADLAKKATKTPIQLESFLVSQTHRHQLRWPSPSDPNKDATSADYRRHHILSAKDDPDSYVREMIERL
jgi:hypothetical protein